jgi:hypothetical protein
MDSKANISLIGFAFVEMNDSSEWVNASIPVAAVIDFAIQG